MTECQDRSHGLLILPCDSNLEGIAEAIDQIVEPFLGLWWNPVPAPRNEKQFKECIKKCLGPAGFTDEPLTCCAQDLSLGGASVAISEKRIEFRPQIQLMKKVGMDGAAKTG